MQKESLSSEIAKGIDGIFLNIGLIIATPIFIVLGYVAFVLFAHDIITAWNTILELVGTALIITLGIVWLSIPITTIYGWITDKEIYTD